MDLLTKILNDIDGQNKSTLKYGYYSELASVMIVDDFNTCINNVINRLGFSEFTFLNLHCVNKSPPKLSNIPAKLTAKYYAERLYENDMSLQCASESRQPFFQTTIHDYVSRAPFDSEMTRCMHNIFELNKLFGYYDYYIVPVSSLSGKGHSALMVTRRGLSPIELKDVVAGCETDLCLLSETIDFVVAQNFPDLFAKPTANLNNHIVINPKPLRVLETLANNDVTINEVADKLSISVVTANQHLKTVRTALGVKTNYAAIKQAVLANLIELKEHKIST